MTLLADGTIVRGDRFLLTEPGDANADKWGYGWYHIAAPQDGWAYSKFLSNAQIGDCSLRDALERGAVGAASWVPKESSSGAWTSIWSGDPNRRTRADDRATRTRAVLQHPARWAVDAAGERD